MKLCIFVGYKFLIKKFNFGVNQCIFGHVLSQNMEICKISNSSAIFEDRDFWFGIKNFIKLFSEHFTTLGVIKYISGHVTGHKLFFDRKVPISLKRLLLDI